MVRIQSYNNQEDYYRSVAGFNLWIKEDLTE